MSLPLPEDRAMKHPGLIIETDIGYDPDDYLMVLYLLMQEVPIRAILLSPVIRARSHSVVTSSPKCRSRRRRSGWPIAPIGEAQSIECTYALWRGRTAHASSG